MLLTIQKHDDVRRATGLELHVLVDGQDVTRDCVAADDEQGWATVAVRDAAGAPVLARRLRPGRPVEGIACDLLIGHVEFAIYEGEQPVLRRIPRVIAAPLLVTH
jgi:hypothetical protein